MNKKSNFTRTVLLGALLCGIAGPSFVGCKDYDDDIENLQVQIDANKDAIAKLQELVNGGAIVTSVESDGNGGVVITLSDGSTHNITKGEKGDKGDKGDQGDQGVQGLPGDPGTPGAVPTFKIENGELMYTFESGDAAQWTSVGKVEAEAPVLDFEIDEATGELLLNGESLGVVKGEKGDQGDPGTPAPALQVKFEVRTDGHLWYSSDNGTTWADLGEVKGPKGDAGDPGNTPTIPTISFSYDEENGLMYQVGTDAAQPIAGFDMAALIADNVKLTVNEEGNLCLNGTPIDPAIEIKNNIYVVKGDGFITLNVPVYTAETDTYAYETLTLPTTDIFGKIVTSVNFVPMTLDGANLKVNKLKVIGIEEEKFIYASPSVLSFRISPSTAVLGTDYKVAASMDYFEVKSRAADGLFTANNPRVAEDGLIDVDFGFDQKVMSGEVENYTLALRVEDMHNEGRVVYSDYIAFETAAEDPLTLSLYQSAADAEEDPTAVGDTYSKTMPWKEGATLDMSDLMVGVVDNGEFSELENYGFEPNIKLVLKGEGAEEGWLLFHEETGVMTLEDVTFNTYNGDFTFAVEVRVGEDLVFEKDLTIQVREESEVEEPQQQEIKYLTVVPEDWYFVGVAHDVQLDLDEAALNDLETFFLKSLAELEEYQTITVNGEDFAEQTDLTFDLSNQKVTVNATAAEEKYDVVITHEIGSKKATTSFTITLTKPNLDDLYANNGRWDADHKTLGVRINSNGGFSTDLRTAFERIENTSMRFSIDEDVEGLTFNADGTITVESFTELPEDIWENGLTVYYQLIGGANVPISEKRSCVVKFTNPIQPLEIATKELSINDESTMPIPFEDLGLSLEGYDPILGETLALIVDGKDAEDDNYMVEISYAIAEGFETSGTIEYDSEKDGWFWKNSDEIQSTVNVPVVLTVTVKFGQGDDAKVISEQTISDIVLHVNPAN